MSDEMRWLLTGLVVAGVIDLEQMARVENYFFAMQGQHEARLQKMDDDFWDDEMRYGSGE